ncbi:MAG: hypothetical protein AAF356_05035 [Planctomycetota bacterium]
MNQTHRTKSEAGTPARSRDLWTPVLSASALVLAGLLLFRLQDGPGATPALGDMTGSRGPYTMMTTFGGGSIEELVAVVDDRAEHLLLYAVRPGDSLDLVGNEHLPGLFSAARRGAGGRP